MAHNSQLPCDGEGICMVCKNSPANEETLTCKTCATPWHVSCLSSPPETLDSTIQWDCPDCSPLSSSTTSSSFAAAPAAASSSVSADLIAAIRAIEADGSLTEQEKAKRRQQLMSGAAHLTDDSDEDFKNKERNEVFDLFDGSFNCSFCMHLPDRPVTTPCGHNFCLKCFQKWIGQGKRSCAKCRDPIPSKMASLPRINSALVAAIRMAKMSKSTSTRGPMKVYHFVHNQNRPDKAYTTERAKRAGKANACSGKIFVTVPPDHFGPILSENDPERKQGVLVGECWEDRMECRQWGAHLPHVAGIAGQSEYGAQSVALSGGYEDDEDHGEWFLYTGSGGRDLSGNKRTNKEQSFDQKFDKYNEALRVSCKKGYPVRVVRSYKEKRSSYAPETGVRYDGIYRIEKCWRKIGIQGFKVCRYLFVRCDNEPAPWTSDEHGDRPRPLPVIKELKKATDVTERKESPSWDYNPLFEDLSNCKLCGTKFQMEQESCWKWIKSPPLSRKPSDNGDPEERKRARRAARQDKNLSVREKLLKEFSCLLCRKVMNLPLTTPCAHNFCKPCLEGAFEGQEFLRVRNCEGRRTLRTQKNVMKCPSCPNDISDFLQNPQVNRELMDVIKNLQSKSEENVAEDEEIDEDIDNDVQEESEESSGTVKSEAVVEDIEVGCENLEMLNGGDKNTQNTRTEIKHKQTQKQKKNDGKKDNESPANAVNGEGEDQLNPGMPKNDNEDLSGPATDSTSNSTHKRKKVNEIKHKQTQKQKKKDGEKNDESPPDAVNGDEKGDKNMQNTRTEIKHKQKKNDGKDNESLVNAVNGEGEDELNPEMPKNDKELPGPATDSTSKSTRKRKKVNEIKHKQTQKQKKNDGEKNDESPPDAVNGDGEGDKSMQNTRTKIKHKQKKNDGKKNNESPVNTVNGEGEDELNPEMPKNDKEDLPGPATDSTSRSTRKRKKVNEIKHKQTQKQKKNDGEKNDESPSDAVNRDGKGELNTETPKNDNENLKGPATDSTSKNTRKRKKGNDPESGLKVGGVKTRSMKSKELANVGNDSPSGPSSAHSEKSQEKQKYKRKKTGNQASGSELGRMKTRAKKL